MRKALGIFASSISYFLLTGSVFAQAKVDIQQPAGSAQNIAVENIPQFIISILFVIGIIVAIAFFIYGGIKWVLSGGDKTAVESARNHIVAAIVGLVIIIAAFFILKTVITLITGSPFDLQHLCIPTLAKPKCD